MACATSSIRSGGREDGGRPQNTPRHPREGGDPYAVCSRFGNEADAFPQLRLQGLWVPAGACHRAGQRPDPLAGTTVMALLEVSDLTVEFATRRGIVKAVQHVSIAVAKGETLGIVGESGSGKSVTSYPVMRILDRAGRIAEGSVMFSGIDVKGATENQMRDLRDREISIIFQNPRAALNPIRKVGDQIEDVLRQHVQQAMTNDRGEKAIEALEAVKIARPRERYHAYPFELSGGMCQRVVIALALACNPQLLIADEPTTGLDVTTQKPVMDLIVELTKRRGMSTVLITHDLGLAAAYCDRVVVMEKGRVVETAKSADIFARPQHAYTKKLMRATPRLGVSLRDLLPEEEAAGLPSASPRPRGAGDAPVPSVPPGGGGGGARGGRGVRVAWTLHEFGSLRVPLTATLSPQAGR